MSSNLQANVSNCDFIVKEKSHMSEALCKVCAICFIRLTRLSGSISQTLRASMNDSLTPFDGRALMYSAGPSRCFRVH